MAMTEAYAAGRYEEACALLPPALRAAALAVPRRRMARVEELRLRVGRPVGLSLPEGEIPLAQTQVGAEDLEEVLDRATEFSRYTAAETLSQGYVTAPGGFRVGVCGTSVQGEEADGLRELSSLSIRVPRVREGVARPVLPRLIEAGRLQSALVLSPPGGGKTTLLRDLVRLISLGTEDLPPMRVSLVDERGELAASYRGRPQLDVGPRTDVLDGCPKAMAVPMLLRAMTPQVIALDELALDEDAGAVRSAAGCGAVLLATAHAASPEELARRPALAGLLAGDIFRRTVTISGTGADRTYRVEALP